MSSLERFLFLAGGGLGGDVAGDGEEHVVEIGSVDGQVLDVDASVVELVDNATQRGDASVPGDMQNQLIVVRGGGRDQDGCRAQRVGFGELELNVPAWDPALQFGGSAFGDDPPVIQHRDIVGQLVSLVEVLGGEEDRHAVGYQLPDDLPHGAAAARI